MEERYEIRGKIGQGGLGAVYRGYDTRMSREVAIKRISVASGDPDLQAESTRQLIKEAGALASLQHPHIVTVYDVGSDEDGPYVVMELISGKTLDELIERAPLTWPDFRELALQTQEALIAAQELDLIHSDIKPSNLMLTWLPSGKFQVKIVDFGLATLTQSQSLEDLQEIEAVFGSIFFMAPEQFERVPIDARTDMYAMGCVYYQALTGTYPFRGETGNEVMESHLYHRVIPLQQVRSDIPVWACDWIMWHLNRLPADRPESARHALQVFLQNDKNPAPTLSMGAAPAVSAAPRPRLVTPAAAPAPPGRPIIDPRMAPPGYVAPVPVEPKPVRPEPPLTTTAPQPLLPPEGSKPSIHTGPHEIPEPPLPVLQVATPTVTAGPAPSRSYVIPPKKKNHGPKILFGALFAILVAGLVLLVLDRGKNPGGSQRYEQILTAAALPETAEIPMSGGELNFLLTNVANADTEEARQPIYRALALAQPNDENNFDAALVEFASTAVLLPEVRASLISEVLAKRMSATLVPPLTDFARSTKDSGAAAAALTAIRPNAGDSQFEPLLNVTQFHPNAKVRQAAADTAAEIIRKSSKREELLRLTGSALEGTTKNDVREALLLIRTAGGGT
jgi:serine/threonine protein kinase